MSSALSRGTLRLLAGVTAIAVTSGLTSISPAASAADQACDVLLEEPAPAAQIAAAEPKVFAEAAEVNDQAVSTLNAVARSDRTLWLGECGQAFYVEPERSTAEQGAPATQEAPAKTVAPLEETFNLDSNPSSTKVVYLDFTGETVTGTAWNDEANPTIVAKPYSKDGSADTNFSAAELTEIQAIWQAVAEDYTPFNINVTTRDPGLSGIERTTSSDGAYGTRVVITDRTPYRDTCGCGGVAYLGVFDMVGDYHAFYQPAWVFTEGTTTDWKSVAEAASHEAGHNLALHHDGKDASTYSYGTKGWAPIMGAGYNQPVSQWSKGEYTGATNTEDDIAIVAGQVGFRADDHGNTAGTATRLIPGRTSAGTITTRSDVDAFAFTAAGPTTVSVASPSLLPNLDLSLTILDAQGNTVSTSAPVMTPLSKSTASGLDASWSVTVDPPQATEYIALVDGVGNGDPAVLGGYSDYASLGAYEITLTSDATIAPLVLSATTPTAAQVGVPYSKKPVTASGGVTPYVYTATGLPTGLAINASTGTITGTPTVDGVRSVAVKVTDAAGQTGSKNVSLTVTPAPVAAPAAPTKVSAVRGDLSAQVSWTAPANNGAPITSYTITERPSGRTTTVAGDRVSAKITGLTTSQWYWFTVVATNARGNSPESASSESVRPTGAPAAPSGVTGKAGQRKVALRWNPAESNGHPVSSYTITRSPGGVTVKVPGTTTATTIKGLATNTTYTFRVVATNSAGNSPASLPSHGAKTSPGEPEPPKIKTARSGTAGGKITGKAAWAAPTHNSGKPVTYYRITAYRYGSNGKIVSKTVSPKLSAAKRSYSMKLPGKGKYRFVSTAYNSLGAGRPSALSNLITGR